MLVTIIGYLFAIADNNVVDLLTAAKVGETFFNGVLIIDVQKAALWPPEQPGVILDGVTFGWGIDDAEHLFQVSL